MILFSYVYAIKSIKLKYFISIFILVIVESKTIILKSIHTVEVKVNEVQELV